MSFEESIATSSTLFPQHLPFRARFLEIDRSQGMSNTMRPLLPSQPAGDAALGLARALYRSRTSVCIHLSTTAKDTHLRHALVKLVHGGIEIGAGLGSNLVGLGLGVVGRIPSFGADVRRGRFGVLLRLFAATWEFILDLVRKLVGIGCGERRRCC